MLKENEKTENQSFMNLSSIKNKTLIRINLAGGGSPRNITIQFETDAGNTHR